MSHAFPSHLGYISESTSWVREFDWHGGEGRVAICIGRCFFFCLRSHKRKRRTSKFFHFLSDSWQSPNGLISSQPSWRQQTGFGLAQDLWFPSGVCDHWQQKGTIYFDAHSCYICHTCTCLSASLGNDQRLRPVVSLFMFALRVTQNYNTARGNREPILFRQQDWFALVSSFDFFLTTQRSFSVCS